MNQKRKKKCKYIVLKAKIKQLIITYYCSILTVLRTVLYYRNDLVAKMILVYF